MPTSRHISLIVQSTNEIRLVITCTASSFYDSVAFKWKFPQLGWVTLNIDGLTSSSLGLVRIGDYFVKASGCLVLMSILK